MFTSVSNCINWLNNIQKFGQIYDLSRMKKACEILDNPQNKFKSIHIGGTNGKGSTTTFLRNILTEANLKIATYTSPFVVTFNERLSINGSPISDEKLLFFANKLYTTLEKIENTVGSNLTFFEVVTLIAFLYFASENVDYAIFEVGLGGKLDATNVITPLVSAITNIGYDHIDILGPDLIDVAKNKLGIVKNEIPLITTENKFINLFNNVCSKNNTTATYILETEIKDIELNNFKTTFNYKEFKNIKLKMLGYHQAKNASLAIEIVKKIVELENIPLNTEHIYKGLENSFWPGRLEIIEEQPLILIDGAHNIDGIKALEKTMLNIVDNRNIHTVFCAMEDKDLESMIEVLASFSTTLNFTTFEFGRAGTSKDFEKFLTTKNRVFSPDAKKLISDLTQTITSNDIILITGSLYFISYIRDFIVSI